MPIPAPKPAPTPLIASSDAAAFLGVKPQTLRKWRVSGSGPRYVRVGGGPHGRVAYRIADLEAWISSRSFAHTAEETAAAS